MDYVRAISLEGRSLNQVNGVGFGALQGVSNRLGLDLIAGHGALKVEGKLIAPKTIIGTVRINTKAIINLYWSRAAINLNICSTSFRFTR